MLSEDILYLVIMIKNKKSILLKNPMDKLLPMILNGKAKEKLKYQNPS